MADNPLAGLRIPSLREIVATAVDRLGKGTLDLAHPLNRERLISHLESSLNHAMRWELERAIAAATARAVSHVFNVMRDADYQEKKKSALRYLARKASNVALRRMRLNVRPAWTIRARNS